MASLICLRILCLLSSLSATLETAYIYYFRQYISETAGTDPAIMEPLLYWGIVVSTTKMFGKHCLNPPSAITSGLNILSTLQSLRINILDIWFVYLSKNLHIQKYLI